MKRARYQRGTVDADPRTRKLYFRWYEKVQTPRRVRRRFLGHLNDWWRPLLKRSGTVSMQANRNKQQG